MVRGADPGHRVVVVHFCKSHHQSEAGGVGFVKDC